MVTGAARRPFPQRRRLSRAGFASTTARRPRSTRPPRGTTTAAAAKRSRARRPVRRSPLPVGSGGIPGSRLGGRHADERLLRPRVPHEPLAVLPLTSACHTRQNRQKYPTKPRNRVCGVRSVHFWGVGGTILGMNQRAFHPRSVRSFTQRSLIPFDTCDHENSRHAKQQCSYFSLAPRVCALDQRMRSRFGGPCIRLPLL